MEIDSSLWKLDQPTYMIFTPEKEPTVEFPQILKNSDFSKLKSDFEGILASGKTILETVGSFLEIPGKDGIITVIGLLQKSPFTEVEKRIKKYVDDQVISQELQLFEDRMHDVKRRLEAIKRLDTSNNKEAEQMRIEITCAMSTCDQIYRRFEQMESIFYKFPLNSPPFLSMFTNTYIIVLQIASEICPVPSGLGERKEDMKKLIATYTERFWEQRLTYIESDCTAEPTLDRTYINFYYKDLFNPQEACILLDVEEYANRVNVNFLEDYKIKVGKAYSDFFNNMYYSYTLRPPIVNIDDTFNMKICKKYIFSSVKP